MSQEHEDRLRQAMSELPVRQFDPDVVDAAIGHANQTKRRRGMLTGALLVAAALLAAGLWLPSGVTPNNQTLATPSSGVPNPTAQPTGSASGEPAPSGPASSTSPTAPSTTASHAPSEFYTEGGIGTGYYFTSPDGAFWCAMGENGTVGCQASVPVTGMEQCGTNASWRAAMVSWAAGDAAAATGCTTQGIFGRNDAKPTPELIVGASLALAGNVCESLPTGISCYPEGSNGGFVASVAGIRTGPDAPASSVGPVVVQAADYRANGGLTDGYYFVSPSQNFVCGIGVDEVGCQARVPVAGFAECGTNPDQAATIVTFAGAGPARVDCTTVWHYYAEPYASGPDTAFGMRVLPYGSELAMHGATCSSEPSGISCRTPVGGFSISDQGITTW